MIRELLASRNVDFRATLPELKRRLDLVKLSHDVLDMYPIELSGGMKQRVVMVISTLMDPALLIADEITSALDVSSQKAVAEMLVEFRNRECCNSAIVITHDLSILYQIAKHSDHVRWQLAEKASMRRSIHTPPASVYQAADLIATKVGVKYAEKG